VLLSVGCPPVGRQAD